MRRRTPPPVEDRVAARVAVTGAMLIALAALAITAEMPVACGVAGAVVLAGYRHSWRHRDERRSRTGQAVIAVALAALLVYLFADLFGGVFGGDLPQAHFAAYVAAVTAFDVKTRRNCFSHIWHSLIILYVAGLFAWSGTFMVVMIAWGACVVVFIAATRRREGRRVAVRRAPLRRMGVSRALRIGAVWLASSVVIFIVLPEFTGRPLAVPLLAGIPISQAAGEALPPVLPLVGSSAGAGAIDLRARGRFGAEVAMHVRSASPSYWRAYSLEVYTGAGWTRGYVPTDTIPGVGGPDIVASDEPPQPGDATLTQAFFIEANLPGQVIGAYPLQSVDVNVPTVDEYRDGSVALHSGLSPGVSYGVVSRIRDTSAQRLRSLGAVNPRLIYPDDVELPTTVTAGTRALAQTIIAGATSEYDAVMAVQHYLVTNERYSLDTPRLKEGRDAVDQFLFTDHLGFCEQFSSAFAVLLRSEGIPARVAVGYATGEYDRFTNSYTVRNNDAHAWTEVLFPGVGWVPFDASPGFDATPRTPAPGHAAFNLDFVITAGGVAGGAQVVGALAVAVTAVVLVGHGVLRLRRRRRMDPVLRAYADAQRRLRRRRLPSRHDVETVAEHLNRLELADSAEAAALRTLAAAVENQLYAGR